MLGALQRDGLCAVLVETDQCHVFAVVFCGQASQRWAGIALTDFKVFRRKDKFLGRKEAFGRAASFSVRALRRAGPVLFRHSLSEVKDEGCADVLAGLTFSTRGR